MIGVVSGVGEDEGDEGMGVSDVPSGELLGFGVVNPFGDVGGSWVFVGVEVDCGFPVGWVPWVC